MHEVCKGFVLIEYTVLQYYLVVFFGANTSVVILSQRALEFGTAQNHYVKKRPKAQCKIALKKWTLLGSQKNR